jgi:hypothetical protein
LTIDVGWSIGKVSISISVPALQTLISRIRLQASVARIINRSPQIERKILAELKLADLGVLNRFGKVARIAINLAELPNSLRYINKQKSPKKLPNFHS